MAMIKEQCPPPPLLFTRRETRRPCLLSHRVPTQLAIVPGEGIGLSQT